MPENRGRAECGLQAVEGIVGVGIPRQGLGLPAEQGDKRGCEQTKTLDEATVEIGEAKESLQFLNRLGSRPFCHSCYLPLVHLDTFPPDDVSQELHRGRWNSHFSSLRYRRNCRSFWRRLRNVVAMVGQVPGVNKDVIYVHYHRAVEELRNTSFMNSWKTEGALERPYGITRYS